MHVMDFRIPQPIPHLPGLMKGQIAEKCIAQNQTQNSHLHIPFSVQNTMSKKYEKNDRVNKYDYCI